MGLSNIADLFKIINYVEADAKHEYDKHDVKHNPNQPTTGGHAEILPNKQFRLDAPANLEPLSFE